MILSFPVIHGSASLFPSSQWLSTPPPVQPEIGPLYNASIGKTIGSFTLMVFLVRRHERKCSVSLAATKAFNSQHQDPWSALGLSRGADREEVRKAFREQIRTVHPDVGGDPDRFRVINRAYEKILASFEDGGVDLNENHSSTSRTNPARETSQVAGQSRPKTIEDFLQWREEQALRMQARREEDLRRRKAQAKAKPKSSPSRTNAFASQKAAAIAREGLQNAAKQTTPEARAAWLREFETECLGQSAFNKDSSFVDRSSPIQNFIGDFVVGHRVVRSGSGTSRVPIYKDANGTRYYVSPLTSKRVTIP